MVVLVGVAPRATPFVYVRKEKWMGIIKLSQETIDAIKADFPIYGTAETARRNGIHKDTVRKYRNGGSVEPKQAQANTPVTATRRDWWAKYEILHDDGRLLKLGTLPQKVLVFGCTQGPFHHRDFIAHLAMLIAVERPDIIVMAGDLIDFLFAKPDFSNPDMPSPREELERAIEMVRELVKVVPQCIMLTSNHAEGRVSYMQKRGNIPSAFLRNWQEVVGLPKEWVTREALIMGRFLFEHGDGVSKGARPSIREETIRRFNMGLTVVRAHRHGLFGPVTAGEWESQTFCRGVHYVGCNMDEKQVTYNKSGLWNGALVIDRGACIPFPMERGGGGRWTQRLVNGLLGE